jgi:hypothetical protein
MNMIYLDPNYVKPVAHHTHYANPKQRVSVTKAVTIEVAGWGVKKTYRSPVQAARVWAENAARIWQNKQLYTRVYTLTRQEQMEQEALFRARQKRYYTRAYPIFKAMMS